MWTWRKPEAAARWHLVKYGPCIMIKTQLGMRTMDRLAKYKRFWGFFGFCSKLVSAILLFLMLYMLIVAVLALPERLASGSSIGIEYALAIPGFNPMLPLSYGIVALVFAMVVHELGHGIQARVNGMRVESSGLLYGVVPLGAFVEPNEEDLTNAPRKAQMDVYAAGITVNTVFAIISIVIMILACGCVTTTHGDTAGVYSIDASSPAYEAGIPTSALIVGIYEEDGTTLILEEDDIRTVTSGSVAYIDYDFDPNKRYVLEYEDSSGSLTKSDPLQMGMYIKTITKDSPAYTSGMKTGEFLYQVTVNGTTTSIGSPYDFTQVMSGTVGGETITVTTVTVMDSTGGCETNTYETTLTTKGTVGFLGVGSTTGGMTFTTPDILMDRATNPFYGADSAFGYVQAFFSYISGPFNGMDPISDEVKWWYDAPMGDIFWVLISLMYWIFWLDILLAISNALPTYILDGGFIFAGGVSWLLEKLRIGDEERRQALTDTIAGNISTVMLFLFLLVIVAMVI